MKVLLVDDEAPARRRLRTLLAEVPRVVVCGEAASGEEALGAVEQHQPDLLLLDIHMPGLDGLSLAAQYAHLPPVVFVTAHDEHAVRAFELAAVDYLLKPVRQERLVEALRRAQSRQAAPATLPVALPATRPGEGGPPRVVTQERGTTRWFEAAPITRFHSTHKYTAFLVGGAEHLTEEPLTALEERLAPLGFLRVHRAELVRLSAIRAFVSKDGLHELHLEDGQVVPVSRRFVAALRQRLGT